MRASVAFLLLAVAGSAAATLPASFQRDAAAILAKDVPAGGPGISAVISENGKIVWSGAAGRADLASKTPLTPDSVFRYASISKQFTAALVLKLAEEGRVSLDDTLGKLLPTETPAAWHAVTVRQLLNHTSGIPSYTSKPGFMAEASTSRPITTQQLIDTTRDVPMDFVPGTQFRYNNSGYVLLSAIVEKLTGKPWYVALREKITGPLKLTSIRCGCEPGPAVVASYTAKDTASQKIDMTVPSGAGALVGNAADLARWAAALHAGKVLKTASYQEMITPKVPAGADERYGFGLSLDEVRGLKTIGHNGGIFGFNTESLYVPERKLFVAVLSNSDSREPDAGTTARRLLATAAGVPYPALDPQPLKLSEVEPLAGLYKGATFERRLFVKDGKFFAQRGSGSPAEAFPAGNGRFTFGRRSLSYFEVSRGPDGKNLLTFYPNGAAKGEAFTYAGPVPAEAAGVTLTTAQQAGLVGDYVAGPAVLAITQNDDGLSAQLTGQPPIKLEAIGPRELRTVGVEARLVFEEAGGKIVRVVLHQGGRTIPFERR